MTRLLINCNVFLTLTFGFTACNGQAGEKLPAEEISAVSTTAAGQAKLVRTQGTHQGDNVHCSLETEAGHLWFGTTGEGVYRYDGKSFSQYTVADGLYSNTVWCLLEDRDGKLWVGTDAGVSFYDGKQFSKIRIPSSKGSEWVSTTVENDQPSKQNEIFSITQDKDGNLWFATQDGVYTYDGQSFTPFMVDKNGKGFKNPDKNNVEHILEDKAGNLWFGGRGNAGVFRFDGKSIAKFSLQELSGHNWAWPVLQDKDGNIWFSNWGGAYCYDGQSFTTFTKDDGLLSNVVTRIIENKDGDLWFACSGENGGICRYDGESFNCIPTTEELISNGIWTILEDSKGNLWLGTKKMGLYRYDGEIFTRFSE